MPGARAAWHKARLPSTFSSRSSDRKQITRVPCAAHSPTTCASQAHCFFGHKLAVTSLRVPPDGMLKITLVDTADEQKFVLSGTLVGPWIGELQKLWEDSRQQLGERRCVVDLDEVTLIDQTAHALLATMVNDGAELVASGMLNRWLIEALKQERRQVSIKALRQTRGD